MDDDSPAAATRVWGSLAGGSKALTQALVEMLAPSGKYDGPRRRCAFALVSVWRDRHESAWSWGMAGAFASAAGLERTFEAIVLLAADEGAIVHVGARWEGDVEAAVLRALGHESVDQIAGRYVDDLYHRGLDEERARCWLNKPDPLLGHNAPIDMISAGYPDAVDASLRYFNASVSDELDAP